jgi:uncharacterized RDD family membrane protein YckC
VNEIENPYAPPQTPVVPSESAGIDLAQFHPAGNGRRFLNFLIDRFAMFGLMLLVGIGLGALHTAGIEQPLQILEELGPFADFALGWIFTAVYYIGMEAAFGVTLGKLITGTRVVNEYGGKPSFGAILGRTLARFVPFEPFSFFGNSPGGWHDSWSGTAVIDIRNPQPRLSPGLRKIYNRY